jgi:hypothetical protein
MLLERVLQSPDPKDWGLVRAQNWRLTLCILPRTCFLSGRKLWGKQCYKGTRIITGPGDPVVEDYWIDRNEFLIWNLKGKK